MTEPFDPGALYDPQPGNNASSGATPSVFIAPQRYIQGAGILEDTPRYLKLVSDGPVAVLASARGFGADAGRLIASLEMADVAVTPVAFGGECSNEEITRHADALRDSGVTCVIAVGGGKCVDAGKGVAWRLDLPVVIVPTLASNDAPCSALSVIYTPEGTTAGVEFYPSSPALVVVDTAIVAAASERYLVAGMGDAMATWYEAQVCLNNPDGRTPLGARPTLGSCALGEVCAHTLYEYGEAAARSVAASQVDDALDRVVEANTLLSGIGFESGGIAAAHGIAQSYPFVPEVHERHLHGEMVAMGLLAQLSMEGRPEEARRAARFFARVGLPVHLGQLSMDPADPELHRVAEIAASMQQTQNMPMSITPEVVKQAILDADRLGSEVASAEGDGAYRRLNAT